MKLSVLPMGFLDQLVFQHTMTLFDWIEMAADLPVEGLEFHCGSLESLDPAYLGRVRRAIERHHKQMPMLCCAPDFTHPDPAWRRREIEHEKRLVETTALLGGQFCRVLSGQRRASVTAEQGVQWVVECIKEVLEYSAGMKVVLAMENHYKDYTWEYPEFAQKQELFLEIVNRIDSPWFGVQYDPSNALLAGEDPIELLENVKHRVVTMHASDRYLKPGHTIEELKGVKESAGYAAILAHGVVGKGMNNYARIFRILREVGFDGWVSIEDGVNGLEDIRASAEFLLPLIRG
jgi:sugar phosphate isomerase/epimerase